MTDTDDSAMRTRSLAEVFPPGEILKEEIEARGWTQAELADILDRPPRLISEIITAKRAITPETAKGLEAALGTPAILWMKLESDYQLSKTEIETSLVSGRANLYKNFPVKELIRRGWVKPSKELATLESNVRKFYGIHSINEPVKFQHAAKKQNYDTTPPTMERILQLAWLNRAEQLAETIESRTYSPALLRQAVAELQACLQDVDNVRKAPEILLKAGVRLVVVEFLPRAKLDGACFWTGKGKSPVIALSLRLDRVDNFWHTLLHEIDHILHDEGKETGVVDVVDYAHGSDRGRPREELRASSAAANYCIPEGDLKRWIAETPRVDSRASILSFATRMRVHPGIIVGQLQHLGLIPYSFHRELLEKVRGLVITAVPTDGFATD